MEDCLDVTGICDTVESCHVVLRRLAAAAAAPLAAASAKEFCKFGACR